MSFAAIRGIRGTEKGLQARSVFVVLKRGKAASVFRSMVITGKGFESIQRSLQTTLLQGARPSPECRLHLVNSVGLTPKLYMGTAP